MAASRLGFLSVQQTGWNLNYLPFLYLQAIRTLLEEAINSFAPTAFIALPLYIVIMVY